ncbi:hypothetical protein [Cellulomonas biazotea]|uniref:hypothetical protein n=1 Tax=Cellulomonas biazotea TaxID=1709 RepID=UPI0013EF32F6|nr:hypothetical protein [Cellulomonas biazotea]
MIYTEILALLTRTDRSRAESRRLAEIEIARTLDESPPDFPRLRRLLLIGTTLGSTTGFVVFLIGLGASIASGSDVFIDVGACAGALLWAVGATQWLRWLAVPVQERAWRGRDAPLPWFLRPSWFDLFVALCAATLVVGAVLGGT